MVTGEAEASSAVGMNSWVGIGESGKDVAVGPVMNRRGLVVCSPSKRNRARRR